MKTLPANTDDASPHQFDPSRASSFRSVADNLQAVACDNKTTEKPLNSCSPLQGGHQTSMLPSSTLSLDRASLNSSASTSSPRQLPLQNQELLPPSVGDAATQSLYIVEAAATHVTKEQYRGRAVEDVDRHGVRPVAEKEVSFSVQPRHSSQDAPLAAAPTARTEDQLPSLTSGGDSRAFSKFDDPSEKSFNAAGGCPVSASSSKVPDVEVSVATAGRIEATSALLPHENAAHGEKQTGNRLSTATTSSSASHESAGTVPSKKKRPQTEQTNAIPMHPPHTQQHQQPPLHQQQQRQPPRQQQQPAGVQNRGRCLVLEARHTFQPLQQHQFSEVDGLQPSLLLPAQALPDLGHLDCSSKHQPLLTGPLPAQGTSSAPSLFAQAGRLDNGSASDRQAPPVPCSRAARHLPSSFPITYASEERHATDLPDASGALPLAPDQQAVIATHSPRTTILHMAVGSQVPQLSASIPLPGTLCGPRSEIASLLTDVQAYSKRPKTTDGNETKFAGGTGGFSAAEQRAGSPQTTEPGVQVCSCNALPDPSDLTSTAALENCSAGRDRSHSAEAQARTECANTVQAALKATAASNCHDAAQQGHGDLRAPGARESSAVRDFEMPLCALHSSGHPIPSACADASGFQVNDKNCSPSSLILGGVACRATPNQYIPHVDRSETNISVNGGNRVEINVPGNGDVREAQHSDANRACTSETYRAAASSQACASTPPGQKTACDSGRGVRTEGQHRTDLADPIEERCGVRSGLPLERPCTTESWGTDSSAACCPESCGSSLLSALTGGTAPCGALPVFTVDGGWCGSGTAAPCSRAGVPIEHKLEQAVSEKEHGPVLDGRLHWGKKRGPYDRPMRTFSHDEERSNTVLAAKDQVVLQRRVSAEQAAEYRSDAVTASVHMASVLGSSSSMASTRATTPTTRPSNGNTSSTSTAAENLCAVEAVTVLPSLTAAPSSKAQDIPASPKNPPSQAAGASHLCCEAPPRRLVRLCDNDEEIWNEWEGQSMLGEGVYGRVYLVRSRKTGEERAFKRMYLQISRLASNRSNEALAHDHDGGSSAPVPVPNGGLPAVVQREIASLKALQGVRNVIPLEEVLIGSRRVYLSFPVIRGGSLSELLRRYAIWQEYLLTVHQTASPACTSTPAEGDSEAASSTSRACDYRNGTREGSTKSSSRQCHEDISNACCDLNGGSCVEPTGRDACHRTRWDCRSRGRCNCGNSSYKTQQSGYSHEQTASIRCCRCGTEVARDVMQQCPVDPAGFTESKLCSGCAGETHGTCVASRPSSKIERALTFDAAAPKGKMDIKGRRSASGNPTCDITNQLRQPPRRSSTCSGKKADEYPCGRSNACGEATVRSTAGVRPQEESTASVVQSLSQMSSCCCCGCCTLCKEMEEANDKVLDDFLQGSSASSAASSASQTSSLPAGFLPLAESSSWAASESFFSPPFSYPHMPPCGLPISLAKAVVQAILRGVNACHKRRIAHRDMKPDNILLDWVPQAPPSPPAPPPSPVSSLSSSLCNIERNVSCTQHTGSCRNRCSCFIEKRGCCGGGHCCPSKGACHCHTDCVASGGSGCNSKESIPYGKVMCRPGPLHTGPNSGTSDDAPEEASEHAPAARGLSACPMDMCEAAKALLLRRINAEADAVARRNTEETDDGSDIKAGSESSASAKAGEDDGESETATKFSSAAQCSFEANGPHKNEQRKVGRKDQSTTCNKKREPAVCFTAGQNDDSSGPRRRRCTENTASTRNSEVVDATDSEREGEGLGNPNTKAGGAGVAAGAAAPAASADHYTESENVRQASSVEARCFSKVLVESSNTSCGPAARFGGNLRDCAPHFIDSAVLETSRGTHEGAGAAATALHVATELADPARCERKDDDAPRAGAGGGECCAVAAGKSSAEEEDGAGTNSSASSGPGAEDEQEASSDTQQTDDSLTTPDYPPLPTRLLIADFGLARTLPFQGSVPTGSPSTPRNIGTVESQVHLCRHKHQQAQVVIPAPAAVPSTRYTSSCNPACWVGHSKGCCGACNKAKETEEKILNSLLVRPQAACACKTEESPADRESSLGDPAKEESWGADASCTRYCKLCGTGRPATHSHQKVAPALPQVSCGACSCSTTSAEDAGSRLWTLCSSTFSLPHGREENGCCLCRDAGRQEGDSKEGLAVSAGAIASRMETSDVRCEPSATEKSVQQQAEDAEKPHCGSTDLFCLSPSKTPLGSSETLSLSPEIITLNYRPLDVLLGSSSYSLGVDVWSVGCIFMELLTGCELIDGCTEFQCIVAIMRLFGNPWKKADNECRNQSKCASYTGLTQTRDCGGSLDSAECPTSRCCCRRSFGGLSLADNISESLAPQSEGTNVVAPCAQATAAVTCCDRPAHASRAPEKQRSTELASRKCLQTNGARRSGTSHGARSRGWRFWSEALPAFQGEDRPLERILRDCGRLDAVADPHLLDFAGRLLTVLPEKRITASEALLHPFLRDVRHEDEL